MIRRKYEVKTEEKEKRCAVLSWKVPIKGVLGTKKEGEKKKKSFSASVLGKRVSDQGADDPRADKHIIGSYILVKKITELALLVGILQSQLRSRKLQQREGDALPSVSVFFRTGPRLAGILGCCLVYKAAPVWTK